ncbi:MAG: thymidylate synthase [Nanobdellota archaeon]
MGEIKAVTTMDAWRMGIKYIIDNGIDSGIKASECRQCNNLNINISKPQEDILLPIKTLSESNSWVYPDVEEIRSIILAKKRNPSYGFTNGQRIFHFNNEVDQINSYLIPLLKESKGNEKSGVITLWNPLVDSNISLNEKPSLVCCMFNLTKNGLRATAVVRSNNLFVGFPANIYQLSVLQDYVAESINVDREALTIYSDSAYIYKENFKDINKLLGIRAI